MPVNNRLAARADAIKEWRRDLHQNPEIMYEVQETAWPMSPKSCAPSAVTRWWKVLGDRRCRHHQRFQGDGPTVGLRSDMDALPIEEETGVPHASTKPGMMHACGHDGHTAMLLGAAEHLCETRGFAGSVAVIFQPAEEGGAGAKAMMDDGLFERFGIEEVYGMHNYPGIPVGQFAMRVGPTMAATDIFQIVVTGVGGHAARPHTGIDPVVTSAQIITMLQTIASRNADPLESIVVSVTTIHAGDADNVIPERVKMTGTVRTLIPKCATWPKSASARSWKACLLLWAAPPCSTMSATIPVVVNHERETAVRRNHRLQSGGGRQGRYRYGAGDGRGGFRLHAGRAARRVHLHRQWRGRRPTSTRRITISTTRSFRSAPAIGSSWSKRGWLGEFRSVTRHDRT
jgi:amidohydrolase